MIIKNVDGLLYFCRKNRDNPNYMDLICHFTTNTVHWSTFESYLINEEDEIESSYDLIKVDSTKARVILKDSVTNVKEGWIPINMLQQREGERWMHLFDGYNWLWLEYKNIERVEKAL